MREGPYAAVLRLHPKLKALRLCLLASSACVEHINKHTGCK